VYRYGGELQLARSLDEEGDRVGSHHVTLREMVSSLERSREAAMLENRPDDIRLLDSLERFYRQSEVVQVAGGELVPDWRRSAA